MKTYTLSLDTFNSQDELTETIRFLKDQYPTLLEGRVQEYVESTGKRHSNSDQGLARNRFAIIMAFDELYNENVSPRIIRTIYESGCGEREALLAQTYTTNKEYLDSKSVDIEAGVKNGLLVEVNYISFTEQEVNYIRKNLNNIADPLNVKIYGSIIEKLNGTK